MAKAKFNYKPVYIMCALMFLFVGALMVIPDPTLRPSTEPKEQRNLLLVFKEGVNTASHEATIKRGGAEPYVQLDKRSYEIVLVEYTVLENAFTYFDTHPDVARVSKGAVHPIVLPRDMMPEIKR